MILTDPGAELETPSARKSARIAWRTQWEGMNASQKENFCWSILKGRFNAMSLAKRQAILKRLKALAAANPNATIDDLKAWVLNKVRARAADGDIKWII